MIWKVEWDERALKELKKIDKQIQKEITHFISQRIATKDDPKRFGKPLSHEKKGLWRYRVRDYRIICKIYESEVLVLVVGIGHRSGIYA